MRDIMQVCLSSPSMPMPSTVTKGQGGVLGTESAVPALQTTPQTTITTTVSFLFDLSRFYNSSTLCLQLQSVCISLLISPGRLPAAD